MGTTGLGLTEEELREGLAACLAVPRWVDSVIAAGPYDTLPALLAAARSAAAPLTAAEIDEALADHPRIGESHAGGGRSAAFSRTEQAASASPDERLAADLAAGNAAYEEKFGRVFLIRAAGRSRPEILAELERRLLLSADAEIAEVEQALREIAVLRIPQLFSHVDHHSGYDEAEAAR